MHEVHEDRPEGRLEPVTDVSSIPLARILEPGTSALDETIRRLLTQSRPGENFAAHGSTP